MKYCSSLLLVLLLLSFAVMPVHAIQPGSDGLCRDASGSVIPCPDGDGDGVPDHQDSCLTEAGTAANNGCPETVPPPPDNPPPAPSDRDGDGLVDAQDQCPDQAGDAANIGCPA